jgi:hypothetical protein
VEAYLVGARWLLRDRGCKAHEARFHSNCRPGSFLWGWRHNPRDMEVCLSLPMPPRPGVRTHQQSIHSATNIAAEVRDEIRGTKIADRSVRLDELVSPDAPQITLMIESQCSRAALGLLISGRTGDPRRLDRCCVR